MAFDRDDIRRWVADRTEESLDEVFSPMRSLVQDDRYTLAEAKHAAVQDLLEAFLTHLNESGIDVCTAPVQLIEAARFVIEEAYEQGRLDG